MRIRFTREHRVQQHDGKGPAYEAGKVYDFDGASAETYARKYIERGYAEPAVNAKAEREAAARERELAEEAERERLAAVEAEDLARIEAARRAITIPEKWEDLPWADLRALAINFTEETVRSKEDAAAAINGELKLRAG